MESSLGVRKGAWTVEEDNLLRRCVERYGEGRWHQVPLRAGLNRCRKSCRLRWLNYLEPNIKRGEFSVDEIDLILRLHKLLGNRWSLIAGRIPGRTANDIKNYWNTKLRKKVCEEQTKATVQQHGKIIDQSKTKVIRPRPRTFSKNYSSSSLVITIPTTTTDNNLKAPKSMEHNDICGTDSTRAAVAEAISVEVHEPNDNNRLFNNDDGVSERTNTSTLLNGEYHFTNLWDENLVMELGDNFMSDLSFDVDFLNFFPTDHAAPEAPPPISFCPINCPASENGI